MSHSPTRCNQHRLHRNIDNLSRQNDCKVPGLFTPSKAEKAPSTRKAPEGKRGRGRPRKEPATPTPHQPGDQDPEPEESEDETQTTPTPSGIPFSLRGLTSMFTPNSTQEQGPWEVPPLEESDGAFEMGGATATPAPAPAQQDNDSLPTDVSRVPETPLDPIPPAPQPQPQSQAAPHLQSTGTQTPADDELAQLRRSRSFLVTALEDSTALVNRLRTRRNVHEADAMATRAMLATAEIDLVEAKKQFDEHETRGRRTRRQWIGLMASIMVLIVAYVLWCWYKSPEMEYIRKRRGEILRE